MDASPCGPSSGGCVVRTTCACRCRGGGGQACEGLVCVQARAQARTAAPCRMHRSGLQAPLPPTPTQTSGMKTSSWLRSREHALNSSLNSARPCADLRRLSGTISLGTGSTLSTSVGGAMWNKGPGAIGSPAAASPSVPAHVCMRMRERGGEGACPPPTKGSRDAAGPFACVCRRVRVRGWARARACPRGRQTCQVANARLHACWHTPHATKV